MIASPDDVPGWISPEYSGGGGGSFIGNWWRVPPVDGLSFDPPMIGPSINPTLNPDPPATSVQPTAATQNEAAESIDANFVLIGAAVVLGVILLSTGKD